jgi:hypothetical protein
MSSIENGGIGARDQHAPTRILAGRHGNVPAGTIPASTTQSRNW